MARRILEEYGGSIEYNEDLAWPTAFQDREKGMALDVRLPRA